ncbi:hypothetical protein Poly24_17180 [Rosistilla carotiformis]|uniref:Uncharacterized protein n=2 Tax=Rosistilla carotiformis TaxID=2528017 RepID=A0A518JR46_9BACT|nr:hypothetical protein Poly24_17180 [Rosistilla carotiformis]
MHQRMTQQNDASLIQFTVRVIHDDGTSILHNTLDDFNNYNEVRPVCSKAAVITWTYLVKFNNKDVPEKQEISVNFDTQRLPFRVPALLARSFYDTSMVRFRIKHTDWTWGADIEGRLSAHLENLLLKESPLKCWLRTNSGRIGTTVGFSTVLLSVACVFAMMRWFAAKQSELLSNPRNVATDTKEELFSRLELVQGALAQGAWFQFTISSFLFLITSVVIGFILGNWVDDSLESAPPSFLRLTNQSEKQRDETLRVTRNSWRRFGLSVVGSVILGILANACFAGLVAYWHSASP